VRKLLNIIFISAYSVCAFSGVMSFSAMAQSLQMADLVAMLDAECHNPEFQLYYAKTSCQAYGITAKQMADQAFISKAELVSFQKQQVANKNLYIQIVDFYKNSPLEKSKKIARVYEQFFLPKLDQLNNDLAQAQLNWGQYNTKRKALGAALSEKIKKIPA
jgi:hypothetical protein